MVEHQGEFYEFPRLVMRPEAPGRIPIYVGGFSKPALRRAARLGDGWVSDLHDTAELSRLIDEVQALRREYGTADRPFEIIASVMDAFDVDGYRRLEDLGVTHLMTMPWVFYGGQTESLDDKLDGIKRFGDDVIQVMA